VTWRSSTGRRPGSTRKWRTFSRTRRTLEARRPVPRASPRSRRPEGSRVFVVVSRQTLIDPRFSTVVCAPVYTRRDGLATQVDVGLDDGLKHESMYSAAWTRVSRGAPGRARSARAPAPALSASAARRSSPWSGLSPTRGTPPGQAASRPCIRGGPAARCGTRRGPSPSRSERDRGDARYLETESARGDVILCREEPRRPIPARTSRDHGRRMPSRRSLRLEPDRSRASTSGTSAAAARRWQAR
jgi:hypothetical protein